MSGAKDLAYAQAFLPASRAAHATIQIFRLPTKNVGILKMTVLEYGPQV